MADKLAMAGRQDGHTVSNFDGGNKLLASVIKPHCVPKNAHHPLFPLPFLSTSPSQ